MTDTSNKGRIAFNIIFGILVLVWSFLVIDKGFYMDESGMLGTYKETYQGNRMFIDTWGVLQPAGILMYPVFALYYQVLEPVISPLGCGFVLYTRICYQLVRLLISVYLYFTIRKSTYKTSAFITAITYYMFFVSFKNFSYKSLCDFAVILIICWSYRFFTTKNKWYFVLIGLATSVAILAFPTMIAFPVALVILLIVMTYKGYDLIKPIIIYCVTCFVCGGAMLVYLQLTSGLSNIMSQIFYTEDHGYTQPLYIRVGMMLVSYLAFAVIAYLPVLVLKLIGLRRNISLHTTHLVLSIYWILFMAAVILLRIQSVSTTRFIYGCLVIFWWYPYLTNKTEQTDYVRIGKYKAPEYDNGIIFKYVFVLAIIVQGIWAVSTNQEVTVPGHMCFYTVLGVIMIAENENSGLKLLRAAVVALALFFMGIWVAESDGGYSDIFEERTYVTYGAYQGIALSPEDYQMNESCYNLLSQYVTSEDRLYVTYGFGNTAYLNTDALQSGGSPFARGGAQYQAVINYWKLNPDNVPDYILMDTGFKYFFEFPESDTAAFINENYKTTVATDGDFILLTR